MEMNPQISKNFSLDSKTDKFWPADAGPIDSLSYYKLWLHTTLILQPQRDLFGPITVTSGKRTLTHNAESNGSKGSHHLMIGDSVAIDYVIHAAVNDHKVRVEAVRWLMRNRLHCIQELIWYEEGNWLHVALASSKHARRIQFKPIGSKDFIPLGEDPDAACVTIKRQDHRFGSRALA